MVAPYNKPVTRTQRFEIGGVEVTATAAELNAMDGITSTVAELNILDGVTSTAAELNILDGVTADKDEINVLDGVTGGTATASKAVVLDANSAVDAVKTAAFHIGASGSETEITATALEINSALDGNTATAAEITNACDVSGRVEELTTSGAVTAGIQSVELNHTSVTIEATIEAASNHQGIFHAKATTEPGGGGDHTLTLTAGTFDGTNDIATFADINDALIVYFDSAGNGTVVENVGTVGLTAT